jgi:hypothetical protein
MATLRPLSTPGKDHVLIVQENGWSPGQVWRGAKNLALTGIQSPDRPAVASRYTDLATPAHKFQVATSQQLQVHASHTNSC